MTLYYLEELTMKEVGAVLGVGESRVSQIHSAAIVRLRARLGELMRARKRCAGDSPARGTRARRAGMEKILNQEEIDALFRATQKGQIASGAKTKRRKKILPISIFARSSQINKEQVRALSTLHESFARNITNSLGAYLRVGFDFNLVSVEQLTYSEIISRLPELTYLCSMRMQPIEAVGLLQMDLAVAFPIMDLVLGGPGYGGGRIARLDGNRRANFGIRHAYSDQGIAVCLGSRPAGGDRIRAEAAELPRAGADGAHGALPGAEF